jgi:hypothetical protein
MLEAGGVASSDEPFEWVGSGQWSRRAGDPVKPLQAMFSEHASGRLKLTVTDFRNRPLQLTGAEFVAPIREIVFERKESWRSPLRLFYGNVSAEPPHYDLERNLPVELNPTPQRLTLSARQPNPAYIPAPQPLAERFPWAIYLVLTAAAGGLGAILYSLGKTAVAMHDAAAANGPIGQAPTA